MLMVPKFGLLVEVLMELAMAGKLALRKVDRRARLYLMKTEELSDSFMQDNLLASVNPTITIMIFTVGSVFLGMPGQLPKPDCWIGWIPSIQVTLTLKPFKIS